MKIKRIAAAVVLSATAMGIASAPSTQAATPREINCDSTPRGAMKVTGLSQINMGVSDYKGSWTYPRTGQTCYAIDAIAPWGAGGVGPTSYAAAAFVGDGYCTWIKEGHWSGNVFVVTRIAVKGPGWYFVPFWQNQLDPTIFEIGRNAIKDPNTGNVTGCKA